MFDVNNDNRSDMIVWRPIDHTFFALLSPEFNTALIRQVGQGGDVPLADTDLDGGADDLVVWRPSDATFYALLSSRDFDPNNPLVQQWGQKGDVPLPGVDFDGDGREDLAVWRPSDDTLPGATSAFYALLSSRGFDPNNPLVQSWGQPGDVPLV
jgi:hypothetical protein